MHLRFLQRQLTLKVLYSFELVNSYHTPLLGDRTGWQRQRLGSFAVVCRHLLPPTLYLMITTVPLYLARAHINLAPSFLNANLATVWSSGRQSLWPASSDTSCRSANSRTCGRAYWLSSTPPPCAAQIGPW